MLPLAEKETEANLNESPEPPPEPDAEIELIDLPNNPESARTVIFAEILRGCTKYGCELVCSALFREHSVTNEVLLVEWVPTRGMPSFGFITNETTVEIVRKISGTEHRLTKASGGAPRLILHFKFVETSLAGALTGEAVGKPGFEGKEPSTYYAEAWFWPSLNRCVNLNTIYCKATYTRTGWVVELKMATR